MRICEELTIVLNTIRKEDFKQCFQLQAYRHIKPSLYQVYSISTSMSIALVINSPHLTNLLIKYIAKLA